MNEFAIEGYFLNAWMDYQNEKYFLNILLNVNEYIVKINVIDKEICSKFLSYDEPIKILCRGFIINENENLLLIGTNISVYE